MNELFDNSQRMHTNRHYQRHNDFLRDIIIEEIEDKLKDHKRHFHQIAIVAHDASDWASEFSFDADRIEANDKLDIVADKYDLILHLGAMHRCNDPLGQLIQSRLGLKPDGLFLSAFLGGQSLIELRQAWLRADEAVLNGVHMRVAPMMDLRDAASLLQRAGFALPVADHLYQRAVYQRASDLIQDLRGLGLSNPLSARPRGFLRRDNLASFQEIYSREYACETGGVYASFELLFQSGHAPADHQPKPLKPGSITTPFIGKMDIGN